MKDTSWNTEDQFKKSFGSFDPIKLNVCETVGVNIRRVEIAQ